MIGVQGWRKGDGDDAAVAHSDADAVSQHGGAGGRRAAVTRFVNDITSFVRLAHVQGTRLVDVFERYVDAAEEHNRQQSRIADAAERLADAFAGQPGHQDD